MTNLEQMLGSILESIEKARQAGNSLVLAALVQRKDAICAALAAPEHAWHAPQNARPHGDADEKALEPLLATSCA